MFQITPFQHLRAMSDVRRYYNRGRRIAAAAAATGKSHSAIRPGLRTTGLDRVTERKPERKPERKEAT